MHNNPIPSPLKGEGKGEVIMKTYIIKNSDIMHGKKVFPEGSTIELEDKEAESLTNFLDPIKLDSSKSLELDHKPSVLNSFQDQHKSELKKKDKK